MTDHSRATAELLQTIGVVPGAVRAAIDAASHLNTYELAVIRDALAAATDPASQAALQRLSIWNELPVAERIAGLLALAECLRTA